MPGFGPASAPVANCGGLGFLEASSSYKIDYIQGEPSIYNLAIAAVQSN